MQEIIALDSQVFKAYVACPRMCKFQFIDKLEPLVKESYFDRGSLVHEMLKVHYKLIKHNHNIHDQRVKRIDYRRLIEIVVRRGEHYSMHIDLPPEECLRAIETYKQYAEYYQGENWIPTHVESAFSVILYDSDDLRILWEGKIDLMVQHGIVDTKTSERRGEPNNLDDQFMGYCFAMKCSNLIINKIGFQKSLKPEDKFERYTKSYPAAIISEWQQHVVQVVEDGMLDDIKEAVALKGQLSSRMYRTFNYTACQKWGCRYYQVCSTEPEVRDWKIGQTFKRGDEWAPAKQLEAVRQ